jgi:hypothetical protein
MVLDLRQSLVSRERQKQTVLLTLWIESASLDVDQAWRTDNMTE